MKHKLHIDSVRKAFGLKQVLTDVYLSCETGEIIGLLGRNASGKSTLLKIIFGSLSADNKFVKIDNQIINSLFGNKGRICYLSQKPFLPTSLKVRKAIQLFCSEEKRNSLYKHHLLKKLLNQKVKELSGGEQRLVELLLLIHCDALFVLLDEPFNGIAPIYKEELKTLIKQESQNKGFIITDHDYRNIIDVSSRLVLIHEGCTKHLQSEEELIEFGYVYSL